MKVFSVAVIYLTILIVCTCGQDEVDWCDPELCYGEEGLHIACDNDGVRKIDCECTLVLNLKLIFFLKIFGTNCVDPALVDITTERIASILDYHNRYRQTIATGLEPPFPEAARMQTLVI